MIKINLCPIDELENQYWYALELATAVVVVLITFCATQYYFGTLQDQVDTLTADQASLDDSTAKLAPDLERFKNLGKDIVDLNAKLHALKAITVSKIAKYKPVIVLEHLQNLKPEGVWFDTLRIGMTDSAKTLAGSTTPPPPPPVPGGEPVADAGDGETFEVKGQAFDNILTAEFMTAIRSTQSQEMEAGDLRTQVFFAELNLIDAVIVKNSPNRTFPELAAFPEFSLRGRFKERLKPVVPKPETPIPPPAPNPPAEMPAVSLKPQHPATAKRTQRF